MEEFTEGLPEAINYMEENDDRPQGEEKDDMAVLKHFGTLSISPPVAHKTHAGETGTRKKTNESQPTMDASLFQVDCSSYEMWLKSTGSERSQLSERAYDMMRGQIRGSELIYPHPHSDLRYLPHSGVVYDSLISWRYKPLNLDFFQLALFCGAKGTLEYLDMEHLCSDENYRGDGVIAPREMPLNHPVHLARFLGLTEDLATYIHLMPWTDGYVYLPEVHITPPCTIVYSNPKRVMVTPSSIAAAIPLHEHLLMFAAKEVDQHPENATSSIIECIWDIARISPESYIMKFEGWHQACRNPDWCTMKLEDIPSIPPASENIFHLCCHIHLAQNWTWLNRVIEDFPFCPNSFQQINQLAEFLSHKRLVRAKKLLRFKGKATRALIRQILVSPREDYPSFEDFINMSKYLLEKLEVAHKQRSLQRMCVLKVLHHAQGNLKGLVDLGLPSPLLRLFHIPFLDLYLKLKAESG